MRGLLFAGLGMADCSCMDFEVVGLAGFGLVRFDKNADVSVDGHVFRKLLLDEQEYSLLQDHLSSRGFRPLSVLKRPRRKSDRTVENFFKPSCAQHVLFFDISRKRELKIVYLSFVPVQMVYTRFAEILEQMYICVSSGYDVVLDPVELWFSESGQSSIPFQSLLATPFTGVGLWRKSLSWILLAVSREKKLVIYSVNTNGLVADFSDPFLALEDALHRQRVDLMFWYLVFKGALRGHSLVQAYWSGREMPDQNGPGAARFWNELNACMSENEKFSNSKAECPSELWFENSVFRTNQPGGTRNEGATANVYSSEDKEYVLKVFKWELWGIDDTLKLACIERSALRALDGLDGLVPRVHTLSSDHGLCSRMSLVERNAGEFSLEKNLNLIPDGIMPKMIAKILDIFKRLDRMGISQNDAHIGNFVFSDLDDVPGTIKLIDLGFARPGVDAEGNPVFWAQEKNRRKHDLLTFISSLSLRLNDGSRVKEVLSQVRNHVELLGIFQRPDYDRYMDMLNALSLQM